MTPEQMQRRNRQVLAGCVAVVAGMVALSFAAVPLYNLFCRVTGYAGTTQVGDAAPGAVSDRMIVVRFDASANPSLGWTFYPEQRQMPLRVGETGMAFYRAKSGEATRTTGTATFNVTPLKAGQYFVKTQCFCFTEQVLNPGQSRQMPVSFYIDPGILDDPNMKDVDTITLSYTFFRREDYERMMEDEERMEDEKSVADGTVTAN